MLYLLKSSGWKMKPGSSAFGTAFANFGCPAGSDRPAAEGIPYAFWINMCHGMPAAAAAAMVICRNDLLVVMQSPPISAIAQRPGQVPGAWANYRPAGKSASVGMPLHLIWG